MSQTPKTELDSNLDTAMERETIKQSAEVSLEEEGQRFDQVAAQRFQDFSRGQLKKWILDGSLTINGKQAKPRQKLVFGDLLKLSAEFEAKSNWQAEPIPLSVIYEDEQLLIIDKPIGLVVHPGAGISRGTLANAVLHHCPNNAEIPRCGIVHRLDKDTSGLLVVAKTLPAHANLIEQLQQRSVKRIYRAIASGNFIAGGSINAPIGRDINNRTKMAVFNHRPPSGNWKEAITHYRIRQRFAQFTELEVSLETGRTHQIRVHLASIKHPLLGDPVYNKRFQRPANVSDNFNEQLKNFKRQALHATQLSLIHPASGEEITANAEPPKDYVMILEALRRHNPQKE